MLALGIAIITVLLLASKQVERSLTQNSRGIDLVVGAKGSPLQIILSSIFHIDYPTGNISLAEARQLSRNRLIRNTIPMALGDSYQGYRIVGTNHEYVSLYKAEIDQGALWEHALDVTLGATAAQQLQLSVGDTFTSSHGLADDGINVHDEQQFNVVGILAPTQTVIDNLILTAVESVWQVHDTHNADSVENHHETHLSEVTITLDGLPEGDTEDQITALLVQFRSPMAAVQLPRYINERTNMQAASPPFRKRLACFH